MINPKTNINVNILKDEFDLEMTFLYNKLTLGNMLYIDMMTLIDRYRISFLIALLVFFTAIKVFR
jgi:hypothetical protein